MGALALVAVALLVLGSMACNKAEDTGTTESTPTDQMPTEGTTSDTGSMTGTMTDTTGTMGATDDVTLQTNVQNAITAQPGMSGVTVTVSMGAATLSGTVASDTEKMAAETAAKAVPGVTSVVNNITVGTAAPATK
jgi:hypothetical protein